MSSIFPKTIKKITFHNLYYENHLKKWVNGKKLKTVFNNTNFDNLFNTLNGTNLHVDDFLALEFNEEEELVCIINKMKYIQDEKILNIIMRVMNCVRYVMSYYINSMVNFDSSLSILASSTGHKKFICKQNVYDGINNIYSHIIDYKINGNEEELNVIYN